MQTFAEALDFTGKTVHFTGKTVHPVTTHAMSGLATAECDHTAACPGPTLAEGLAVQGKEVADAGD